MEVTFCDFIALWDVDNKLHSFRMIYVLTTPLYMFFLIASTFNS